MDASGDGQADDDDDDGLGEPEVPEGERTEVKRWRRLTGDQYANAVHDLLGVDVDASGFLPGTVLGDNPFPSNAGIAPQAVDIEIYWQAANAVAEAAIQDVSDLLDGCDPADPTCATAFIEDFASRAFRRPLDDAQRDALADIYALGAETDALEGLRMVISAVLQTPQFLYLTEYGTEIDPGLFALDGYEVATRLSFLLTNSTPDRELLDAAPSLDDPQSLRAQAERLMTTPAFLTTLVEAQLHLTHISRLDDVSRSEPEFTPQLRASMRAEAIRFVETVLVEDGTLEGLLTTPAAFPDAQLADTIYGFGGDGARVDVTDGTRAGLLTLPAFLASSPPIESDYEVVYRGHAVRNRLLCDVLPPPPPGVGDSAEPPEPGATPREILERHQEDPSCRGCHSLMDNIGFGLLNYDDLGRWRDDDSAGPIDASGYILTDQEIEFDGAVELSDTLASLPMFRRCMSRQFFRLAMSREPDAADAASLGEVEEILAEDGGDIRRALLALIESDTFRLRRGQ